MHYLFNKFELRNFVLLFILIDKKKLLIAQFLIRFQLFIGNA